MPIHDVLGALVDALAPPGSSAVVVAPPGSGKTTVIPLAIDDAPWCHGRVLLVEPRRLAARAAAQRMATTRGEPVGRSVGWRMRGDTKVSAATRVEVVTEGVLIRLLHADPALEGVATVVLDEFHERSLDIDLALALLLDARATLRPDLRVVVMSATLDGAAVADVLDGAPVISGGATPHPVAIEWLGPSTMRLEPDAVAAAVRRALTVDAGDVLVFVPGAPEIRRVATAIGDAGPSVDVLALHGRLAVAEQDRALTRVPGRRRVVLATAIAETSLTIDGVTVVVDAGWAREARYDARRAMGGLVTVRVSQAGAAQRAGRAGRTRPGTCLRLWAEHEHARLAPRAEPELRHADLVPVALDLLRWGDPDGRTLRWLDAPDPERLGQAREVLLELGLVRTGPGRRPQLTDAGHRCAELPVHPRLAHAIVRADELGHGPAACTVVAALGERDTTDAGPDARHAIERVSARRDAVGDRVRREAARLARLAGIDPGRVRSLEASGLVLALAYPDRVGKRRSGAPGRFLLTSGAGAALDERDPLASQDWLAIADLDHTAGRGDARIRLAAPLDERDVDDAIGHLATEHDVVRWDERTRDVVSRHEERIGAIVRTSRPRVEDRDALRGALLDGVRREGLALLGRIGEADGLRARAALCRRVLGDDWPDLSDAALLASLDTWLAPWLDGCQRRRDLDGIDIVAALRTLLGWRAATRLDDLAPTHVTTAAGTRRALDYGAEGGPALAVRLQELFGAATSPTVVDGRVPVVLHLLSPAGRPVQVTSDLAGFWRGSYAQVRAELRGRYPKHSWPEDPTTAEPSRGPRRR